MLTLTDNADAIVTSIVAGQNQGGDAGLRIEPSPEVGPNGEQRFAVSVVPAPSSADQVIDTAGAHVFLETSAAEALDDKVLDAGVSDEGAVSFAILPQPV